MRTQNQNPNYVKAHIVSDQEAAELENRSSGFEGASWFLAVVLALIGAIQYWTG
jgi:hypothetical protein